MAETNLVTHRQVVGNQVAIIFIHGFMGNVRQTWARFPELLSAEARLRDWDIYSLGYPSSYWLDVLGIWKANPDIPAIATTLRTTAALPPLQSYGSLTLIAHSMGGLAVQRALVDDDGFAARVGHVLLFGTPSNGLVKAVFSRFWKQQLDNMAEGGAFITDLRQRWSGKFINRPSPFKFCVVAGDQDEFVPRRSSIGPFQEVIPQQCFVIPGDHLSLVKPEAAENLALQLVFKTIIGEAAAAGSGNAARVALEARQFHETIRLLEPHCDQLDRPALVQLALAYEGVGRQADAIHLLESNLSTTDAMGVLAGRLKRRWWVERRRADAERARALYAQALELSLQNNDYPQAFYHGINVAFMHLAFGDRPEAERLTVARTQAQKVLEYCAQSPAEKWRLATEGEAQLLLGNPEAALASYQAAVAAHPTPRELDSMYQQAIRIASLLGDEYTADRLSPIFGR
jgi:pimeloyl-ACP methyl ester carboxylesterase